MAVFNEPTKWQTSLVNSGDANVIPQSTPVGTGEASFDDGFPQITQIPIGAGGIAPDRKDFNGLFKILGDWIFFNQNGGVSTYSENFDYVAGRVVSYNDNIYKCIQANGVSSTVVTPDSDTAYWQRIDNFVRSVNGVNADTSGNVTLSGLLTNTDFSTNTGYVEFDNGFIIAWNEVNFTSNTATVNKPKPFTTLNAVLYDICIIEPNGNANLQYGAWVLDQTTTTTDKFYQGATSNRMKVFWFGVVEK